MASHSSIYAELLSNIRQVSLAVSLASPSDASTQVTIAADGRTVELRHHGEVRSLTLPSRVALGATALPTNERGSVTLSWRLPLGDHMASLHRDVADLQTTPWSAMDFEVGSEVACRQCGAVVVDKGAIEVWKDLPSENWAEMMEFWHCHKPGDHDHDSHGDDAHNHTASNGALDVKSHGKADEKSLAARGYGANSALTAQKGVGFVDLATLWFADTDCDGLMYSLSDYEHGETSRPYVSTQASLNIFCSSCETQLGFYYYRTAAVTLFKWQVSCRSRSGAVPGIPECLASTITATTARSGSSKSLIMPITETITASTETENAIHVWVMNSSIVYSSSEVNEAVPAIKLLYRLIPREEADRMLDSVTCDAQEINLPAGAITEVVKHLDESNLLLPESQRVFKEWKVGLLKRLQLL
ncbi:ubiquitin-conjugating enzyme E2-binding protein [Diplogelasinospora grovesii]|uniref:Ubiquitin-conjugating enzyme E2-binding protein n=1 Tax=Diplogelasinospora grovesii TaxID=303347 RepID=A0AAN6N5F0_9PEZI|nr:ubiquitin-conjugating enzyme E2-binding protein [Diplogelasinospora grovesii]